MTFLGAESYAPTPWARVTVASETQPMKIQWGAGISAFYRRVAQRPFNTYGGALLTLRTGPSEVLRNTVLSGGIGRRTEGQDAGRGR